MPGHSDVGGGCRQVEGKFFEAAEAQDWTVDAAWASIEGRSLFKIFMGLVTRDKNQKLLFPS